MGVKVYVICSATTIIVKKLMIQKLQKFYRHLVRRASLSGLVGLVVVAVVISMVIGSVQAIQQNFQGQLKVDEIEQKVAVLELEVETQKLQNQYFTTDEFAELQARRLLNKAGEGERVINLPASTIQKPAAQTAGQQTPTQLGLKDRSNLEQWLYFLFDNKKQEQ